METRRTFQISILKLVHDGDHLLVYFLVLQSGKKKKKNT